MEERCPTCHRAFRKDRSNQQNRYYWGVVIHLLSEHTGFTPEEMHETLKYKFLERGLKQLFIKGGSEKYMLHRSSTSLNTKEFEIFLAQVRTWASLQLGCYIPEPNEAPTEE